MAVVDNCCTVHVIMNMALPDLEVLLDVWHFRERSVLVANV